MQPEVLFAGSPLGLAVFRRVCAVLQGIGPFEVRTSESQVAFRRRRGFAYLWRPRLYLRAPAAGVALSIVLGRRDPSPRFKEVAHPALRHWMHRLEIQEVRDVDDEVAGWLREAADRAG